MNVETEQTERSALAVGAAGFALMVAIGTMYGLSAVLAEIPRLQGVSVALAPAPFGAASLGLAAGTYLGSRTLNGIGARLSGVLGASLWGLATIGAGSALAANSLTGICIAFGIGGIGVGVAYLAVVTTVGPRFAAFPIVGSAIGPFGFAAGTASVMFLAATVDFATQPRNVVASSIIWLGAAAFVLAILATAGMPSPRRASPEASRPPQHDVGPMRKKLSILLFVNVFPGMLVLAVGVNLLAETITPITNTVEIILGALTIALFLGGLLAPSIRRWLGADRAFVWMLMVRVALLLLLAVVPVSAVAVVGVAVVLFGHGAGFSLIPALLRANDAPQAFASNYGRVLISWGLAGTAATLTATLSLSVSRSHDLGLIVAACVALGGALWLRRNNLEAGPPR